MNINKSSLKNMDSNDIYNMFYESFTTIHNSFAYLNISDELYKKIVLDEINNSKIDFTGEQRYDKYILNRVKTRLRDIVKNRLSHTNTQYGLISDFINYSFNNVNTYRDAFGMLTKTSSFLDDYDFEITPDLMAELINNNAKFKSMVTQVYARYCVAINEGKANKIFANDFFVLAINIYCDIEKIDVKEDVQEDVSVEDTDSIRVYLEEISGIPLLTREEEIELGKRIMSGDKEAKNKLVESNLKLVVNVARNYRNLTNTGSYSFMDIVQEGNMGLFKAADKFDYQKGTKFSTYATWWIKQSIMREVTNKSRNIRIPDNFMTKLLKFRTDFIKIEQELGRTPNASELAERTGLSRNQINKYLIFQEDTVSLDEPVRSEFDGQEINALGALLENGEYNVEEEFEKKDLAESVHKVLNSINFTPNELYVIYSRFGFNNNTPKTLETIGKDLGVTRERVRQIETTALNKIYRNSEKLADLAVYADRPTESIKKVEELKNHYYKNKYLNINKKLKDSQGNPKRTKVFSIYDYFSKYSSIKLDSRELINALLNREINSTYNVENYITPTDIKGTHLKPTVYDCDVMMELLNNSDISNQFSGLKTYELMMILLRYGYINNKAFSYTSIGSFFEIDYNETREIIKSALQKYSYILSSADELIRYRSKDLEE